MLPVEIAIIIIISILSGYFIGKYEKSENKSGSTIDRLAKK